MKILVGVPNSNFNVESIKKVLKQNNAFDNLQIYYDNQDFTQEQLDQIDILLGYDADLLKRMLDSKNSHLKWIQALSAGIDYFPLQQIKKNNVILTTVKGLHAEPIAETVIGMILGQYRAIDESARKRSWYKPKQTSKMIKHKNAVVFGTGNIGSRIAGLLDAFGANSIGVNHSAHPAKGFKQTISTNDMNNAAITNADLIINALPLTKATTHLFNAKFFSELKQHPMFISIGRGPSTDTNAITSALEQHQLGAAALDVTEPEPLPADNPLWKMDNVLITSHISGLFAEYMDDALDIFSRNLKQFKQNHNVIINKVNLSKGY